MDIKITHDSIHEWEIKELIVVEGKNDAHAVRRALGQVDIIWTEGFGLSSEKLKYISEMAKRKGVIVCTDPDFVGNQIREKIQKHVPEVSHVYLPRKSSYNKKGDDIGVENASPEAIREAFAKILNRKDYYHDEAADHEKAARHDQISHYNQLSDEVVSTGVRASDIQRTQVLMTQEESITMLDLVDNGLVGMSGSAEKRRALGQALGIGDTNAKQFLHRVNRFGINREEFMEALRAVERMDD